MNQHDTSELPPIALDASIRPQDDFFRYVTNEWLAAHPIPESETRWGTFHVLREEAQKAMRGIYEELEDAAAEQSSITQQARDFYYTGMHYDELEATHLADVASLHQRIDHIHDTKTLSRTLGELHKLGFDVLWYPYVDTDNNDSTQHVFRLRQGGLTLPNRDYYLEDTDKMKVVRHAYEQYISSVYKHFPHIGVAATQFCQSLIAYEAELARVSRSSADLRDVEKNYNKTTYMGLKTTYTSIDWVEYAAALGWDADDKIAVEQPEFLAFVDRLFAQTSLDDMKSYLKWRITCQLLSKVSARFSALHFEFFGKILSGTTEILPLWKRVVQAAEYTIGEGTGRLYAERHFPESSKQQVLSLVDDVRTAYSERIDQLDWMSSATKQYAKRKLANIKVLIGYPDTWRDFSGLTIGRTSYIANILAGQQYEVAYWLKKLHEPTSRDDWFMTPQTVNAYSDPSRLVICFPAAILQKPFFDPQATIAANMGGIGMVIGHELTHSFDDQGCMFDADGNVRTWQTTEERTAFDQKAKIIIDQADAFEVLPGLTLRGKLVIGESIADLGGLEIALHALKTRLGASPEATTAIQQFFINYAFTECTAVREEKLREAALTDPHPTSEFRVNAIVQHMDDFYEAFDVHQGDSLYMASEKRARIW
jgi:putative endopeptidase